MKKEKTWVEKTAIARKEGEDWLIAMIKAADKNEKMQQAAWTICIREGFGTNRSTLPEETIANINAILVEHENACLAFWESSPIMPAIMTTTKKGVISRFISGEQYAQSQVKKLNTRLRNWANSGAWDGTIENIGSASQVISVQTEEED